MPVGDEQIVEIDAAKRLDFAGDGLRILHARCSIRSSRLKSSTSNALRMCAQPSAQELHDLALVVDRIELGSYCVRARRNLRERERGGEHLDEDQVHRATRITSRFDPTTFVGAAPADFQLSPDHRMHGLGRILRFVVRFCSRRQGHPPLHIGLIVLVLTTCAAHASAQCGFTGIFNDPPTCMIRQRAK